MEKIGNLQTKDRIADTLREEILSGRIADGEELAQEQLAQQLGVSRMPVREALQILELEGLLLRLPNRHMQVVGLNDRTANENFRLVAAVELEIALIALEQERVRDMADGDDFHAWISEQVDNPYLRMNHRRLLGGYPSYVLKHSSADQFATQNKKICVAFHSQDADSLTQAIRSYYRDMAIALMNQSKGDRK